MKVVFVSTTILNGAKLLSFSLAPCCQILRVTDEALLTEIMVRPISFLINLFTALKESQFYFLFLGILPYIVLSISEWELMKYVTKYNSSLVITKCFTFRLFVEQAN